MTFERYLKAINDCTSLVDAKRMRHQIVAEIRKKETQIGMPRRRGRWMGCLLRRRR